MYKQAKRSYVQSAFLFFFLFVGFGVIAEEPSLEDPTKPSDFVGAASRGGQVDSEDMRLEAIIISGTHKVAVINQKIVEVGDRVGTKKIIYKKKYKVVLREGKNKDSVLTLFDTKVKEVSS